MESSNWAEITKKTLAFVLSIIVIIIAFRIGFFYIPFVIAFAFSQLLEPLIRFCMKKFKMKRKVSALLIFAVIISAIIGIMAWGIIALISEATSFLNNFNLYYEKLSELCQKLILSFNIEKIQISSDVRHILNEASMQMLSTSSGWVKGFISKALETITSLPSIVLYIVITILVIILLLLGVNR